MTDDVLQGRRERRGVVEADIAYPDSGILGQLEVRRQNDDCGTILVVLGELDLGSAAELRRALRAFETARDDRLVIDLRGLSFMDCSGIAILVEAQQSADANGYRLALRSGPGQARRLLELTGFAERFTFLDGP